MNDDDDDKTKTRTESVVVLGAQGTSRLVMEDGPRAVGSIFSRFERSWHRHRSRSPGWEPAATSPPRTSNSTFSSIPAAETHRMKRHSRMLLQT